MLLLLLGRLHGADLVAQLGRAFEVLAGNGAFHFAAQLAKDNVRVNAICPGPIDTSMIEKQAHLPGVTGNGRDNIIAAVPLGLGQPDDIAYGALFLASNRRARYITGEILDINGGLVMD